MKLYHLNAKPREKSTRGALNQLRNEGFVPAIVYGKNENANLSCFINDLNHLIHTSDVYKIHLKAGEKEYITVIKDVQYHALTDQPVHIDFLEVDDEKVVKLAYSVMTTGAPVGVRTGGKLYKKLRKINLKGRIADMPEHVIVDVSDLDIGMGIRVKDIQIPNIEIMEQPNMTVANVARTRVTETAEETAAEGAEAKPEGTAEKAAEKKPE